jgi:hypothetical protein
MRQVVLVACMGDIKKNRNVCSDTLKKSSYLEDLSLDGTIILKSIYKEQGRNCG